MYHKQRKIKWTIHTITLIIIVIMLAAHFREQPTVQDTSVTASIAECLAIGTPKTEYVTANKNIPHFNTDYVSELKANPKAYETYSDLDNLGRCGVAESLIGPEIMPTEERGQIGSIKPTGWHTVKYAGIDGNYLYNRCHLIAYCLTGENANDKNLITGTRFMNTKGMLPFETKVLNYIKSTDNHVLYRATPIFENDNLVANGVLLEALSIEDDGEGIKFCVFCPNVQPGVTIDYSTGKSEGPAYTGS